MRGGQARAHGDGGGHSATRSGSDGANDGERAGEYGGGGGDAGGTSGGWRRVFDTLMVFEQDFDTAMEIMLFQDDRVAQLSQEGTRRTHRRRKSVVMYSSVEVEATQRRNQSKKRRRTGREAHATDHLPSPPRGCTPVSALFCPDSQELSEDEAQQSQGWSAASEVDASQLSEVNVDCISPHESPTQPEVVSLGTGDCRLGDHDAFDDPERVDGIKDAAVATETQAGDSTLSRDSMAGIPSAEVQNLLEPPSAVAIGTRRRIGVDESLVQSVTSTTVASLFQTGSGRAVQVSRDRVRHYEAMLLQEEKGVDAGAAEVRSTGTKRPDAGAATGADASSSTVAGLFRTGSGKPVRISKELLRKYDAKLALAEETSVAGTPVGPDPVLAAQPKVSPTTVAGLFQAGSGNTVKASRDRVRECEAKLAVSGESTVAVAPGTQAVHQAESHEALALEAELPEPAVSSLFQTGSGKIVKISRSRLHEYETKLLVDEEKEVQMQAIGTGTAGFAERGNGSAVQADVTSTTVSSLFRTGSGKTVKISAARMREYEEMLLDEDEDGASTTAAATSSNRTDQTAAPAKAKATPAAVVSLFQTGSGKSVAISADRLRHYETSMALDEDGKTAVSAGRNDARSTGEDQVTAKPKEASTTVSSLFQTGSGKAVKISTDRLREYEAKLTADDVPLTTAVSGGTGPVNSSGVNTIASAQTGASSTTVSSLFQTGSGKAVQISKARLQAYESKSYADEENVPAAVTGTRVERYPKDFRDSEVQQSAMSSTVPSLFQTGSGKAVKISKDRLREYEAKIRDDEEDKAPVTGPMRVSERGTEDRALATPAPPKTSVPGLFQTRSGKAVMISTERLREYDAKLRVDEEEEKLLSDAPAGSNRRCIEDEPLRKPTTCEATVSGLFQTGSGKAVKISTDRLRHYEAKMRADEDDASLVATPARLTGRDGEDGVSRTAEPPLATVSSFFLTGSGNAVKVSKDRLRAYEAKLFADDDPTAKANSSIGLHGESAASGPAVEPTVPAATVPGLSATGSDKAVKISTDRLLEYEAKTMADDLSKTMPGADQAAIALLDTFHAPSSSYEKFQPIADSERVGNASKALGSTNIGQAHQTTTAFTSTASTPSLRDPTAQVGCAEISGSTTRRRGFAVRGTLGSTGVPRGRHPRVLRTISANEQLGALGEQDTRMHSDRLAAEGDPLALAARLESPGSEAEKENPVHQSGQNTDNRGKSQLNQPAHVLSWKQQGPQIAQGQPASTKRPVHASLASSRMKQGGKRQFRPPLPSKNAPPKDVVQPAAAKNKKQRVSSAAVRPFPYKEAMLVSFSLLLGMRSDGFVPAGEAQASYAHVLNSITPTNAVDVLFKRENVGCVSNMVPTVSVQCSSDAPYDPTVFWGPREIYGQLRADKHIVESTGATFEWFFNHYRWIVWKLAAMERSFPRFLLEKYLTKDQVMQQMSHRYLRDLHHAQRSVLKKILHRDASSLNCMVLCIAAVLPFPASAQDPVDLELPAWSKLALVLTDGWYSIYAVPDSPLAEALWKLHGASSLVGTKIATWNASLQNSTEGIDPLECAIIQESTWKNPLLAKENLTQWPYLQLHYNSTRRVDFGARLGVEKLHYTMPAVSRTRKQQPQLTFSLLKSVPLKSLEVGGGMVRSVRIRVTRISPVLHLQAKEWTMGPRILCEEQLELYFQLRAEFSRALVAKQRRQDGADVGAGDAMDERLDAPLPMPFIKLDVECSHPATKPGKGTGVGVLTIWRPSEELLSGVLKEGVEYFASSLTVNWKIDGGRGQDAFLRLSSTKSSAFEQIDEDAGDGGGSVDAERAVASQRVCVDVRQATTDYRANFENGLHGRSNERRATVDVCVCVVLVAARDTQQEGSSSAARKQAELSLIDPELKPKETRFIEHVFVTDRSHHLMSIRVSGVEVAMPQEKTSAWSRRGSSSSFVFRRGGKSVWREGAVVCLSGLEVSHYDEQLRVLDCVLVESTQVVSFPSKKSLFYDAFQLLQREMGTLTPRGSHTQQAATATAFLEQVAQLKKYIERDILQMEFTPTQPDVDDQDQAFEQERLTQELQAHEGEGNVGVDAAPYVSSNGLSCRQQWEGTVTTVLPLLGPRQTFPRNVVALAYITIGADNSAFRTVYLSREAMTCMQALLQGSVIKDEVRTEENGGTTMEDDAALIRRVTRLLDTTAVTTYEETQGCRHRVLRFEVRQATNERLLNSWKPWERLHASYWLVVAVSIAGT